MPSPGEINHIVKQGMGTMPFPQPSVSANKTLNVPHHQVLSSHTLAWNPWNAKDGAVCFVLGFVQSIGHINKVRGVLHCRSLGSDPKVIVNSILLVAMGRVVTNILVAVLCKHSSADGSDVSGRWRGLHLEMWLHIWRVTQTELPESINACQYTQYPRNHSSQAVGLSTGALIFFLGRSSTKSCAVTLSSIPTVTVRVMLYNIV
mmetsp:Transcript_32851/g.48666  ORF Transcript_32851/g.48666 Transcript_32851/m.48666 type:complete len:204 (-) Transcript_32851:10-621(-)